VNGTAPRAVGAARLPYDQVPRPVRRWVETVLGSHVVSSVTQVGGMSPGCAARLLTADGGRAFIKAVSTRLNPSTPELFRHEINVLSAIGTAPYRPAMLATYDRGDWVALLLEDVEGRHPDLR